MSWEAAVFYGLAIIIVAAALGVVFSPNIVRAAFFLAASFLGMSALFFSLGAQFLGLVQLMVYAGAVSVLIVFAVMLVIKDDVQRSSPFHQVNRWWGAAIALAVTGVIGQAVWQSVYSTRRLVDEPDRVGQLAEMLMGNYVVSFEVAAVLLLVAVVGAIILSKGEET